MTPDYEQLAITGEELGRKLVRVMRGHNDRFSLSAGPYLDNEYVAAYAMNYVIEEAQQCAKSASAFALHNETKQRGLGVFGGRSPPSYILVDEFHTQAITGVKAFVIGNSKLSELWIDTPRRCPEGNVTSVMCVVNGTIHWFNLGDGTPVWVKTGGTGWCCVGVEKYLQIELPGGIGFGKNMDYGKIEFV
jgi:hypothetical protein